MEGRSEDAFSFVLLKGFRLLFFVLYLASDYLFSIYYVGLCFLAF